MLFFCQKIEFDNLHEMSEPFFSEKSKSNIINLSFAEFAHRVVKVNRVISDQIRCDRVAYLPIISMAKSVSIRGDADRSSLIIY